MTGDLWSTILSWLLTYSLQSTLLLAGACMTIKLMPRLNEVAREAIWKSALVAGIITATLSCTTNFSPFGGALVVDASRSAVADAQVETRAADASLRELSDDDLQRIAMMHMLAQHQHQGAEVPAHLEDELAAAKELRHEVMHGGWMDPFSNPRRWALGWISACAVFAGAGTLLAGIARMRLNRRLRTRVALQDPGVRRMLVRLCHRAGVHRRIRLTQCDDLRIPMAFGVFRPEICLPTRAIESLRRDELESLLAHELAHLVHRDPAWLLFCHFVENALFFQPLNRLAGRRIRELSEFRCDAWAADITGRAAALARCLTQVAGWLVQRPAQPALHHVAGMAHDRSVLHRRIERLVGWRAGTGHRRARRVIMLVAALLTGGSALALPSVQTTRATADLQAGAGDMPETSLPAADIADAAEPVVALPAPDRHDLVLELRALGQELSALVEQLNLIERAITPLEAHGQFSDIQDLVRGLRNQAELLLHKRAQLESELINDEPDPTPVVGTADARTNQGHVLRREAADQEGTIR